MDEFFNIEKSIGEIIAVIGLQFNYEKEYIEDIEIEYEQFPEPEPVVIKKPVDGEEEEEQPPAQEEEEESKKPKFKKEEYRWTITDAKPKNLPQLFNQCKGVNTINDTKTAE